MFQAVVNLDGRARLAPARECDFISFFVVIKSHGLTVNICGEREGFDSGSIENEVSFDFHLSGGELTEVAQALVKKCHADIHGHAMGKADQIEVAVADFVFADMRNCARIGVDDS